MVTIIFLLIIFAHTFMPFPKIDKVFGGARWPRGQCAQSAITEAKQCSQSSVIGWVTKIYYLELLHTFAVVSTRCISRRVDFRQAACRKNKADSLTQHDENSSTDPT
jgi:hypothetical protein